jgi:hypothetical protein
VRLKDPLDDDLSDLVDWLVGSQLQKPRLHPLLTPIKAKCTLRTCLDNALAQSDIEPPILRAHRVVPSKPRSSILVLPSSSVSPSASIQPSVTVKPSLTVRPSASSSSSVVVKPVVVVQPLVAPPSLAPIPQASQASRHLMVDAAYAGPGALVFTYDQSKIGGMLGLAEDTFFGLCNAVSGRFLADPDTLETYLKSFKGKADLMRAQERYESVGKADKWVTASYKLSHLGTVGPAKLTAADVLKCIDASKGTRMILYLLDGEGGGHAIGIVKKGSAYRFFDVNEGLTDLANRTALWQFLFVYVENHLKSLNKEYTTFCMGHWA